MPMNMGAEKHGSKSGGGYVGGLLHLFDWHAKSRKKLFSSKSCLPEESKQKKRCDGNLPMTRFHLIDEDEFILGSSVRGSSDYSCASSVTDEDVGGARPPGVVARLMGLDSMPTSNYPEPYATPYFCPQSLKGANPNSKNFEGRRECELIQSGNLHNNMDEPVRNVQEPKHPKPLNNRPIEKFQTEILPPKSAKSIPITHHKLLSPIKSANFIPSENAIQIMEAAARIIGPGPHTTTKVKLPVVGSSSVPLKVRDLKEKVEASQKPLKLGEMSRRPGETNALKHLKGQSLNKSWNASADTISLSSDPEECSSSTKGKGKSISLALQAKANVQKREGLNSSSNRSLAGLKESSEVIPSELFKSQASAHSSTRKKPSPHTSSGVLRQNNQKQNCLADRGKLPSKPSASNSQGRKGNNGDSSFARYRSSSKNAANSKVVSRRLKSEAIDGKREESSSTRSITCKKRSIDGNFQFEKNHVPENKLIGKNEKMNESNNGLMDKLNSFSEASKRTGTDVVSFTFTAPMARSFAHSPETFREAGEKNDVFSADYRGKRTLHASGAMNSAKFSLSGDNVIGGDALSNLLEQKLRELTHGIETSHHKAGIAGSSPSIFQESVLGLDSMSAKTSLLDYRTQDRINADDIVDKFSSGFASSDLQGFIMKHKFQVMDQGMDNLCRNNVEARKLLDYRLPSPISVLEHSVFAESCNSSDTADSINTGGSKQSSSVQAQEVLGIGCLKKLHHSVESETELSDSASSNSTTKIEKQAMITSLNRDVGLSTKWELEYVREILSNNIELMFKDFAMGRAREIINPQLFDQLESRKWLLNKQESKRRRKVLFDCVTECLDIRFRQHAVGGYETWMKGLSIMARSKGRLLADELYKEISGWNGMRDCMVDELVDKDMSSKHGRWLDFEMEAFELGVQIESRILNVLLDEVIADILLL